MLSNAMEKEDSGTKDKESADSSRDFFHVLVPGICNSL